MMLEGLQYIIKKYLFLSVIVASLTCFTYISVASVIRWDYVIASGLATFLLYNFHGLLSKDLITLRKNLEGIQGNTIVLVTSMLCLYALFTWTMAENIILFVAGLLAFGYFVPFTSSNRSFRDFYWLKPLTIGAVYAILTALIPYHQSGYTWYESGWLSLGRLLFVGSLSIIFDIGDVVEDDLQKVKTIPQEYGRTKAKLIGSIFLILALIIESYGAWVFLIEVKGIVSLIFTYMVSWVLLIMANEYRKWWYFLFLVDGMMGLPWILAWLL